MRAAGLFLVQNLRSPFVPQGDLVLPRDAAGFVAFRGDDPGLPAGMRAVTGLHVKFIPTQASHPAVVSSSCASCVGQRELLLAPGALQQWLSTLVDALPGADQHVGAVPMREVLAVHGVMQGSTGHLVGVPIDKNRILCFEDPVAFLDGLLIEANPHLFQDIVNRSGRNASVIEPCMHISQHSATGTTIQFGRASWQHISTHVCTA